MIRGWVDCCSRIITYLCLYTSQVLIARSWYCITYMRTHTMELVLFSESYYIEKLELCEHQNTPVCFVLHVIPNWVTCYMTIYPCIIISSQLHINLSYTKSKIQHNYWMNSSLLSISFFINCNVNNNIFTREMVGCLG